MPVNFAESAPKLISVIISCSVCCVEAWGTIAYKECATLLTRGVL